VPDQSNSDGLPYSQVDRSAKPKAAMLSTILGVTYQHAIGGLVEFWDLCGPPRELERLLESGIDKVVLDAEDLERRFLMGMGKPITAAQLVSLGLAEEDGVGYRVRGMSRYFEPIRRRVQNRIAAANGGKASAAARKAKSGTAQPVSGRRSGTEADAEATLREKSKRSLRVVGAGVVEVGSDVASGVASESVRSDLEADAEATPKREPNTADSGQRSSTDRSILAGNEELPLDPLPAKNSKPRGESPAEEWFAVCVEGERRHKIAEDEGVPKDEVTSLREAEKITAPYLNAVVKRLREWTGLDLFGDGQPSLSDVWGAYLDDPANAGRSVPYSFKYFAVEGVVMKYLSKVRTA
jgi:hypothetical protein